MPRSGLLCVVCTVLVGCATQTNTVRTTPAAVGLASEDRLMLEVTAGPPSAKPVDLNAVRVGDPLTDPALAVAGLKAALVAQLSRDGRFQVRQQAPARIDVRVNRYALTVVETRGSLAAPEFTLKGSSEAQVVVRKGDDVLLDRTVTAEEQLPVSREFATTDELATVERRLSQSLASQIAGLVGQ